MAASCNFLQIPFSRNPNTSLISPSRAFNHPSRPFPLSLSLSSNRPPSLPPISSNLGSSFPWIGAVESSVPMIVNPSLRHANVLFFNSAYNVQIVVDENEAEEALLRRFKREVSKAGVIQECKRRRYFENKQEEKKRKTKEAARRNRRRRSGPRYPFPSTDGDAASKKAGHADDVEDNWEMPEGDLPS